MKYYILLVTLFFSTTVFSTTTTITDTTAQNFASSTSVDLNEAYFACQDYATNPVVLSSQPNIKCLWFAVGDVIKAYSSSTDRVWNITIDSGHEGWYRVNRFDIQPNAIPEPAPPSIYNDEFFDLSFAIYVYRATTLSDLDGLSDYRDQYQGFRDNSSCPDHNDLIFYPDYTGRQIEDGNLGGLSNIGFGEHSQVWDPADPRTYDYYDLQNYQLSIVTHCTDPTPTGLSCEVSSAQGKSATINQNTTDTTAYHIIFGVDITLTTCSGLNTRIGFPAREFLYGLTEPVLPYPKFPESIRATGLFNTVGDDLIQTGFFIPNNYDEIFLPSPIDPDLDTDGDGVPDVDDPCPTDPADLCTSTDTDGDGEPDSTDQFPNDPTETVDTDSDGVGDNSDPCPTDPLDTCVSDPIDPVYPDDGGGTGTGTETPLPDGTSETTFEFPDWNPVGTESEYADHGQSLIDAKNNLDLAISNAVASIETLFTPSFGGSAVPTCDAGVTTSYGFTLRICWTDYIFYIASIGVVILLMAAFTSVRILLVG